MPLHSLIILYHAIFHSTLISVVDFNNASKYVQTSLFELSYRNADGVTTREALASDMV